MKTPGLMAFGLLLGVCLSLKFFGCGRFREAPPKDTPLIGTLQLLGWNPEIRPTYQVMVPVCNQGPEMLNVNVKIESGVSEAPSSLTGFTAPAGTNCGFVICEVNKKRTHPIRLHLNWQRGSVLGSQTYIIKPGQDNQDGHGIIPPVGQTGKQTP